MGGIERWLRRTSAWARSTGRRLAPWARSAGRRLAAWARRMRPGPGWPALRAPRAEAVQGRLARLARAFGLRGWRSGAAVAATGLGIAVIAVAALGGGRGGGGGGSVRLLPGPARPEIIGFYQNPSTDQGSLATLKQNYQEINTVLAFWYSVDGLGALHAHAPDAAVTAWVKSHHVRMGVLINNIAGSSGNNGGMLTDPAARARAVRNIAALVHSAGYQEVNIDFELLKPDTRAGLVAFMQDLRRALPSGVLLSESVFPKVGVTSDVNGAYDYVKLAQIADYLVIMLYDKHSDGGPAGPVSPYSWVAANMRWFLQTAKIPASRLVLAAGVYGYDWPVGSTHAQELPLHSIVQKLQATGATRRVDGASEEPYFRYRASDGTEHVVWYQDQSTVLQRLKLARSLHLRGVSLWALGEGTQAVWSTIDQAWGPK